MDDPPFVAGTPHETRIDVGAAVTATLVGELGMVTGTTEPELEDQAP
jgi:hypothetical protein